MNTLPPSWSLHHSLTLPGRAGRTVPADGLPLEAPTRRYLAAKYPGGLYVHQEAALRRLLAAENVCLATPTASGKTAVFHAAALDELARNPKARILALYPMKALGAEQEARWVEALALAGIDAKVGRIDGGVSTGERNAICSRARVLIATPDVVHTWLLPRTGQRGFEGATRFVAGLELVVVDEAHTYTGAFGSSAAFAFRRLQHLAGVLGTRPRFVAASATMRDARIHLERLIGRPFCVIGDDQDTSHRHPVTIELIRRAPDTDFHTSLAELLASLRDAGEQFVAFFDSRKNTEQMASILQRGGESGDAEPRSDFDHLTGESVLPFRAGFEAEHRALIQRRLTDGSLRGVLSTSTLELGLDLPHLKTVVLVGVPSSGTNLRQRIGRVGRNAPGRVLVVDSGSLGDELTFQKPEQLLDKPLHDSTIYLENRRVQYAHAMALARTEGEHDRAALAVGRRELPMTDTFASWPEGFLELCKLERDGQVPSDLKDMKIVAGDQPTQSFLLRDVEPQFEVWCRSGMQRSKLGTLSHSQVMREAYPGAVYYYTGRAYRVLAVNARSREILVRGCPRYFTTPMPVHDRITPQREVHGGFQAEALTVAETDLQIWKAVLGFNERRGSRVDHVKYPCSEPVHFDRPRLSRNLFTTGVCLSHPALQSKDVDCEIVATLLLESFLITVPLERQDIDAATDILRGSWAGLDKETRFVTLFDQASGSLRISGRLRDPRTLREVLEVMSRIVDERDRLIVANEERSISEATRAAIRAMRDDAAMDPSALEAASSSGDPDSERVRVLLPSSKGTSSERPGQTFEVHNIFVHRLELSYRGVFIDEHGTRSPAQTVPIAAIRPLDGFAKWGTYDLETGEQAAA